MPALEHQARSAAGFTPAERRGGAGGAAQHSPFDMSIDSIMRGPRLVGYPPTGLRFSGDSRDLYFEWRGREDEETSTFVIARTGGTPRKLTDEERRTAPAPQGVWDRARRRIAFVDEGDIVLVDTVARTRRQVTRTAEAEANPRFTQNDTRLTFTRGNGLFVAGLEGAGDIVSQVLEAGPKKPEPKLNEQQQYLQAEELKLLEWARRADEKKKRQEAKAKAHAIPRLEIKDTQSLEDAALSGDGRHVFALVTEKAAGETVAMVPRFVSTSAHTEPIPTRTKVGDAQEARRLAVLDLQADKTTWVSGAFAPPAKPSPSSVVPSPSPSPSPTPQPSATPGAPDGSSPRAPEEALTASPSPRAQASPSPVPVASPSPSPAPAPTPEPRGLVWEMPVLSRDGRYAVASASSADNKDRWLVTVDPRSGETQVIDHQHDEAWVREMGTGPFGTANIGFLPDDRRLFYLSEHGGYMHLYLADAAKPGRGRALTEGKWEVGFAELTPSGQRFLLVTSEVHPGEQHLYTLPIEGGARTRLTTQVGAHSGVLSPDERTLALLRSTSNRPPEVFLRAPTPGAPHTQVTTSPSAEWLAGPWLDPQLVTFKARDGVQVPARLYTPEMLNRPRDPQAPAVIFVHGAGYLQNVHRFWSTYYREYMFHHLLAERGYVVLDVDYRGSAGYGRDWRTAIYRHMGGKDLDDIVDGAAFLAREQRVDPTRIGVYGGSYGGFITLMALFTSPDTFAAGAALRPVTDWAHYNHGYTSNILNVPQHDAEAYRRSSPIYFAEGLKKPLLMLHGMVDVNVHYQDSVRLAQRLIELRKPDWELAGYPVEDHAFVEETSWADEYRRILKLFEREVRLRQP